MTAAAGFAYHDGIVLCADTLLSGGIVSGRSSKIWGFRFSDGVAVFAISGHTEMAEAAMQQCEEPLKDYSGEPRKRSRIAAIIRSVLSGEYKTHVIQNGYENSANDYDILLGLHSTVDGLGLYATARSQMRRSRAGCEVAGSGEVHALMAIQRFGGHMALKRTNARRASLIAAYALGQAKRYQEDAVGGDSVIIHIESDGMVSSAHGCNESITEKYADQFHKDSDFLMTLFLDLDREEQFVADLSGYPKNLRALRQRYREEVSTTFDLGPIETSETMWEINPPEFLAERRVRRGGQ